MRRGLLVGLITATLGMTACSSSRPVGTIEVQSTAASAGDVPVTVDANGVIDTALEILSGQRGDKEDAPGALRVDNLLARNGAPVDIDVYWGRPDEGEKAATLAFGQVSDYLTPRRAQGSQDAVFTITVAGTMEELMTWDRWSPQSAADRATAVFTFDGEAVSLALIDENPATLDSATNQPMFPAADAGQVRLRWWPLGDSLDLGESLLSVTRAGTCLTNGSYWAGPDGSAGFDVSSSQVPSGSTLGFAATCDGEPISTVVAPTGGRAILLAHRAPDGSSGLQLLPVVEG